MIVVIKYCVHGNIVIQTKFEKICTRNLSKVYVLGDNQAFLLDHSSVTKLM